MFRGNKHIDHSQSGREIELQFPWHKEKHGPIMPTEAQPESGETTRIGSHSSSSSPAAETDESPTEPGEYSTPYEPGDVDVPAQPNQRAPP